MPNATVPRVAPGAPEQLEGRSALAIYGLDYWAPDSTDEDEDPMARSDQS